MSGNSNSDNGWVGCSEQFTKIGISLPEYKIRKVYASFQLQAHRH